jgi:hypothetical protein
MSRGSRIIFCLVFSLIVLAGVGLFFASRLDPVVQTYNSQKNVCNFEYSVQLNSLQSIHNNCAVLQNDWLRLSVKSNLNVSLSVSIVRVTGGKFTLFNNTSTNLNASFPLMYSGAIETVLTNPASNVSEVNGSLLVQSEVLANTTSLSTVEPYRTVGEGMIAIGALGIFLVIWNPSVSVSTPRLPVPRRSEHLN